MTIAPPNNQPQTNVTGQPLPGLPGNKKPEDMTPFEAYIYGLNEFANATNGQVTLTPENGLSVKLSKPIETHEGKVGSITINPPTGMTGLKYGELTHPDGSSNWDAQFKALQELTKLDEIILSKLPAIDMNLLLAALRFLTGDFVMGGN